MAYQDLHAYLSRLESEGEIIHIQREVDPVWEVAAVIRRAGDKAVYCDRVKGSEIPMVGNLFGSPHKMELCLDLERDNLVHEFWRRSRTPIDPVMVSSGSVQERVYIGNDVNLHTLPIPLAHEFDGGRIVDSGLVITRDPELGYNVSIHRLHLKGPRKTGLFCGSAQHLRHYMKRAWERGKPLEIAIAIGADPALYVASQTRMGYGISELQVAGGLRQAPVELVQCKTVDLAVPADAEIVLEGFIPQDEREPEGPYGEYTGYYGTSDSSPVVHYKAMTTRQNPVYQMILIGKPPAESNYLTMVPKAATVYQIIRECVNEIRDVYITPGSGGTFHCIVSIKKRFEGEPQRAILAALGSRAALRQVVIVDGDIDIRNPVEVEWAVATRSEFRKDTILADNLPAELNPAPMGKAGQRFTTGLGIDATLPLDREYPKVCDVHQETLRRVDAEWESYVSSTDTASRIERRKLGGQKGS
jgi:2,5-furandicarboxylate decarboxylase 1